MKKFSFFLLVFFSVGSYCQSVGINTSNPQAKLDVNGDVRITQVSENSNTDRILVKGDNNIVSQAVMPNFFGITGLRVPVCGTNGVGSDGSFQVNVGGTNYTVNWEILEKFIGTQSYPLQGQRIQVKYDFSPALPFSPDGFSLTAYNNSNYPDTFNISYDNGYSASSITVNISRTDITSTDENGSCWGGQFYFDMLVYRYGN